jgi:ribulose-bisphosphate carboxylase large chain
VQLVLQAIYRVRSDAPAIEARARAIAIEQSVEMPVEAIDDETIKAEIVGRVLDITDQGNGDFAVRLALAAATVGADAGQLMNMLFGNTSLHDDVILEDVEFPANLLAAFGGPRHGPDGLRQRVGAGRRALTCSALKPQGLPPKTLADLARRFAYGGIDYVKDDHGLANQAYSPFAARVEEIAGALRAVGTTTRYVPSLSGDLDAMRAQIAIARAAGLDAVMLAPMVMGLANAQRLIREHPQIAFVAHPSLSGSRILPPLLFGKIFRMIGADAVIYANYGGRFGYSPNTCRQIARTALAEHNGLRASLPVPAGGMTIGRIREMLDFYGPDIMLLIGGDLLAARERLAEQTKAFVRQVHDDRSDQA